MKTPEYRWLTRTWTISWQDCQAYFPEYRLINNRWEVSILLDDPVQSAYLESEIIKLSEDYDRYVKMHFACLQAREVLNWGHESDKLSVIFESMQA